MTAPALTAFEIAATGPLGVEPIALGHAGKQSPAEALRDNTAPAVAAGRCFVSFSGGRDSSIVLAAAVHAARHYGHPLPIPVTLRFPGVPSTDEEHWQRQVLDHLGVNEWERIDITDELDFLGPVARRATAAHGLLFPGNAHCHIPIYERSRGGIVLTGFGGDEILGNWRWHQAAGVAAGRADLTARGGLRLGHALAPLSFKRRFAHRRAAWTRFPWLRPAAAHQALEALARQRAEEPFSWPERLAWQAGSRARRMSIASAQVLAGDAGATAAHPLLDPSFLRALADHGGRWGFGDRTATLRACFAEWLPDAALSRRSKALFGSVLWNAESRRFARTWDGEGVDPGIVDVSALRQLWREDAVETRTALLLQHLALVSA